MLSLNLGVEEAKEADGVLHDLRYDFKSGVGEDALRSGLRSVLEPGEGCLGDNCLPRGEAGGSECLRGVLTPPPFISNNFVGCCAWLFC